MNIGLIVHALGAFIFILGFAYLIWATAAKSEGTLKSVGTVLAIAIAAIGALFLVGVSTAPMFGGSPFGLGMHGGDAPAIAGDQAPSSAEAPAAGADQAGKPEGPPPKP